MITLVHEPATKTVPTGMVAGHCPLDTAVTKIDGRIVLEQELTVMNATAGRAHCPGSVVVYVRVPTESTAQLANPAATVAHVPFSVRTMVRFGVVTLVQGPKLVPAGGPPNVAHWPGSSEV